MWSAVQRLKKIYGERNVWSAVQRLKKIYGESNVWSAVQRLKKIYGERNVWSAVQRLKKDLQTRAAHAGFEGNNRSVGYGKQCSLVWSCVEERGWSLLKKGIIF